MTFESMIENNSAVASLPLKVTCGQEIRRATFAGNSFENINEVVSSLFGLEKGSFLLKYQDDDDDKITMSSDGELQDALKLVKEKNLLRLFVELKGQATPAPVEAEQPSFGHPSFGRYPFPHQRGAFPRGPHHYGRGFGHGPHFGGHAHHGPFSPMAGHSFHGPFSPTAGHSFHGPFRGGHHHGAFHGPFAFPPAPPAATPDVNVNVNGTENGNVNAVPVEEPGHFNPANHYGPHGPWAARCAFKEHKRAMKEQLQLMKENASTKDDRLAIKEFKQQMMAEFMRAKWQEKMEKNGNWNEKWQEKMQKKHGDKWAEKCEKMQKKHGDKWAEKWQEKMQEKMEKKHGDKWAEKWQEKMEKKHRKCEKKGKCEKKHKKDDNDRLMAKHVCDVTIPDNQVLPADTPVTKTWKLRNVGLAAWPADCALVSISKKGQPHPLNGPERVAVAAVAPGAEVAVSVSFITPQQPGRYIAYYRMVDAQGAKFGQRVWVSFIIPAPVNTTTVTAATAQLSLNNNSNKDKDSDLSMD